MTHHHLSRDERVSLAAHLRAGHTQAACARMLGVHRSTISRELRRVADTPYTAGPAGRHARERRTNSKKPKRRIENNQRLMREVVRFLRCGYSPEQISKHLGSVSDDAIYAWLNRSRKDLRVLLPQRGRKRHRYATRMGMVQGWTKTVRNLAARPRIVDRRSRIGDWEGDTICGRDRGRLLVHVERKSRFLVVRLMPDGMADTTHAAAVASLRELPCRTITYDRGSEFALWKMIERDTGARVYFAGAHHPWERGTSENSNGLLRRFFPKGTPLGTQLVRDINRAVRLINHRPRKSLNWKTPCAVFRHCCDSS